MLENMLEIERKWLISGFPSLPLIQESLQEQGYLAFKPATVRIRKTTVGDVSGFVLCIKGKGKLVRQEVEQEISEEKYVALKQMLQHPTATKLHRVYALPDGQKLECSLVDEGEDTSFFYAEVEFEGLQQAESFVPLDFFLEEVTDKKGYSMAAYCRAKKDFNAENQSKNNCVNI